MAPAAADTLRPKRPLGVSVLTIYLGLLAGILPIVASIGLVASGSDLVGGIGLVFTLVFGIGIGISAVGAWRGAPRARDLLVLLASLHYLGIAINNGMLALDGTLPDDMMPLAWGRVVRSILTIGILFWYFRLSGRADPFYHPDQVSLEGDLLA